MPLINGQKMACVPCIRGHRSTKCNHSADRIMVPVRKPGRPLSSCACPPGQSCACGGIKVAIPRKQKCKCGEDTANGDHDGHDSVKTEMPTPALTPSELPVSPTRNGVFRIQKPGSISKQNGRKQSFDPAHLGRIDLNSVNIVTPYSNNNIATNGLSGVSPQGPPPMHGMALVPTLPATGYHQPGVISYGPPLGYALVPIHSQLNSPALSMVQTPDTGLSSPPNGHATPATNGATRSCCAPAPAVSPPPQPQVQTPQARVPPKKSCCGGGSNEKTQANMIPVTHQGALSNGNMVAQFQPSFEDVKHPQQQQQLFAVSYANNPNIYTYPANIGTWSQPLNAPMWAQLQQAPQQQPNGAAYSSPLPLGPDGGAAGVGTSHECSCGPGCQCEGCLAHPFNTPTQQYISSAYADDIGSPYGNNSPAKNINNAASATNGNPAPFVQTNGRGIINGNGANDDGGNGHMPNGVHQPANPEGGSPTQAQTPSSDTSGFNEELPPGDFMFVNYELYQNAAGMGFDSCGGSLAFCPCGNDCQCVGCAIHNQPLLDARQFEE
ncbi:hypothetical protein CONLIGDRAFT_684995 [Coniochaeta ligniaria NRRL 30616]|uniref:Copper-fist domain-containing protein n=1 Tax=Coniochaeta ligniaria NRRL 30616 TaxID=1408157 RepID=A0A1J7ICW1_9PEZI|nr:hypothetical protein CONLIGDRAFT_684995 [Coniochaeta ligniaria NRRL 30616]